MLRYVILAAAAALPIPAAAQTGDGGFCESYVLTSSTDGACPACRVTIAAGGTGYTVTSNTGWTANLDWVDAGGDAASGSGAWGSVGDEYAGQIFDIGLTRQGEQLTMLMNHRDPALSGAIESTYFCDD